jgi:hypothetical protein
MMRLIRSLSVFAVLIGTTHLAPARAQIALAASAASATATTAPTGFPANLRWSLTPKWIQWAADKATNSWPPNDGCSGEPAAQSLTAGQMIDRFGSEGGTFFSPKGESYRTRGVPYVCRQMDYRVYRVVKPIAVKSCKAAPWFNEPVGALQVQTADPAYKLVAAGMIEAVSYAAGGTDEPAPRCGRP